MSVDLSLVLSVDSSLVMGVDLFLSHECGFISGR